MPSPSRPAFRPTPPEAELLLCCARRRVEAREAERILNLVRQEIDWELLIRIARVQGVVQLLYTSLAATCPDAIPPAALKALRGDFHRTARNNFVRTRELLHLLAGFKAHGIHAIPFKGPVLALSVYQDLSLRQFGDLDFLVEERHVPAARDLLLAEGYRAAWSDPDWEHHFEDDHGRATVDLHHRIAPSYFPTPASFSSLWERLQEVRVWHTTALTLAPEDLLALLSVELLRDCYDRKPRLSQICDVAELVRVHPGLRWESVVRWAEATGGRRAIALDLLLANVLLGAALPPEISSVVHGDPVAMKLAGKVYPRLFRSTVPNPEGEGEDSLFYLAARERMSDKRVYLRHQIPTLFRRWVTPTDKDRALLRLPSALGFLYYLVRPVRVVHQWMRTGRLSSRVSPEATGPIRDQLGSG